VIFDNDAKSPGKDDHAAVTLNGANNVLFSNSEVKNTPAGSNPLGRNGIKVSDASTNVSIIDVKSHHNTKAGLLIHQGSQNVVVKGGSYYDNGMTNASNEGYGVRVNGFSSPYTSNIVIDSIRAYDTRTGGGGTQLHGVYLNTDSSYNTTLIDAKVQNCDLTGNVKGGLLVSGGGTFSNIYEDLVKLK
jgi:hypothetical protein